jgi:hypothetical protein
MTKRPTAAPLFDRLAEWTGRTASIDVMVRNVLARTGKAPSVDDVSSAFAMERDKVIEHFRLLGLPT